MFAYYAKSVVTDYRYRTHLLYRSNCNWLFIVLTFCLGNINWLYRAHLLCQSNSMLIVPIYYVNFIFYFWFPPITANVHCAASSHTLWWAPKMEVSNSYKLIYLIDLCVDSSVAELELPAWKPRVVGQELEPNF